MRTVKVRNLAAAFILGLATLSSPLVAAPVAASVPTTTDGAKLVAWLETRANPDYAYRTKLTRVQKKAVRRYLTPVTVVIYRRGWRVDSPTNTNTAAGEVCQSSYDHLLYQNWLGGTVWEYDLDVEWCWNGLITSTKGTAYAPVIGLFWEYKSVSRQEAAGVGYSRWSLFTQAQFQLCIFKIGCLMSYWPWKDIEATNTGTWQWTAGGF